MSSFLLGLWIMLIGADRIDFAGGRGPFILTPFLALTPIVMLAELVRRSLAGHPLRVNRSTIAYGTIAFALLTTALVSVYFSQEVGVSGARTTLLLAMVAGNLVVALLCSDRDDLLQVLARGALFSLFLFVIFDVREALWFIGRGPEIWRLGPMSARFDALQNAGSIPRLAGPVADGNRGGYVLLFYFVVIAMGERRPRLRTFGLWFCGLLLFATLSRSTALSVAAALSMGVLTGRVRVSSRTALAACLALLVTTVTLMARPQLVDKASAWLQTPEAQHFTTSEGSAQSHVALIKRGIDEGMTSIPQSLTGLGYGNSYLALQDFFPGNKYGNYHSLYVTMFAEAGIGALLLTLVILFVPLCYEGPWRVLVAGAIAFNVFYQTTTEPSFWFMIALAWISISATARAPVARPLVMEPSSAGT